MTKSYSLREPYKGTLVGGSVPTGVDGGSIDIMKALDKGNGAIVTDNSMLQSVLENYYGHDGLVFESRDAEPGSEVTLETDDVDGDVAGTTPSEPSPTGAQMGNIPVAEHGEQSDYETFTVDELKQEVSHRELQVPPRASKKDLVQALEEDDKTREGAGK